jgi:hypothetical protein
MKRNRVLWILAVVLVGAALPIWAAERAHSTGGHSPHETFSKVFASNRITIIYGRPYTKDWRTGEVRKIWGTLVPFDQVWRTGADEATLVITQKPIKMGDVVIPAGAFSLYTLPASDGSCKLIINKQIGQWGLEYHEDQDLGRVDLKKDDLQTPADQFTMALDRDPDSTQKGAGILSLEWENVKYSVPFALSEQ